MRIKNIFGSDDKFLRPNHDSGATIRLLEKRLSVLELALTMLLSNYTDDSVRAFVELEAEYTDQAWHNLDD